MQNFRISTKLGQEQKVTVQMNQDYDVLEILSLRFSQKEAYTSICADYGVVCGRVTANDGLGIPNVRVSIFVPITDVDKLDPVVSKIYPYENTNTQDQDYIRYNLLPKRKQHTGHTPVGTFPDQYDILQQEEVLEIYEKYYKYTAKTNDAGDYMIWGVPTGSHIIHFDTDLSDIGCQSLVPFDLMYEGVSSEKFENKYTYMSSTNLDGLPQIITINKTIQIYPFWGNQDLCEIGITRTDFDLKERGVRIHPYALMMGGTASDGADDKLGTNCDVAENQGERCRLITRKGDIEAIRFNGHYENDPITGKPDPKKPILESFKIDSTIDEHGVFFFRIPMNLKYITTNEFGEIVESKNPNIGVPTAGNYRFRMTLNDDSGESNTGYNATFLIPNAREYHTNDTGFTGSETTINKKSYAFSLDLNDYPSEAIDDMVGLSADALNDNKIGIPQEYFYQFRYGRVYTISSFINRFMSLNTYRSGGWFWWTRRRNKSFLGIKDIFPDKETDCTGTHSYFPINDATRKARFNLFLASTLNMLHYSSLWFKLSSREFTLAMYWVFGWFGELSNGGKASMMRRAKEYQFKNIMKLHLITYPDCYDCEEEIYTGRDVSITVPAPDIPSYTGTTALSGGTPFYMAEKYAAARAAGSCSKYTYTNGNESGTSTVSYVDCNGTSQSLLLTAGQTFTLCGRPTGQPGLPSGVTVVTESSSDPSVNTCLQFNADNDAYFRPTGSGYNGFVPYNLPPSATTALYDGKPLKQIYILSINVLGSGVSYFPVGYGQAYQIVYDAATSSWKILGLYGYLTNIISNAYNLPLDSVVGGTAHGISSYIKIEKIWCSDFAVDTNDVAIIEQESGCSKYDTIIEDRRGKVPDMYLKAFEFPITMSGGTRLDTYAEAYAYLDDHLPIPGTTGATMTALTTSDGTLLWNKLDSSYTSKIIGNDEEDCEPRPTYNFGAVVSARAKWPGVDRGDFRNDDIRAIRNGKYAGQSGKKNGSIQYVDPLLTTGGTLSGWSEFRDGVYTLVPLAGRTGEMLTSFRRRRTFASLMCGGIVNYTFVNSWINGFLYFFKFSRNGNSYCKQNIYKHPDTNYFYYRSTPYSPGYSASTNSDYTVINTGSTTSHAELQYDYNPQTGTAIGVNTGLTKTYISQTKGFYGTKRILDYSAGDVGGVGLWLFPISIWYTVVRKVLNSVSYLQIRREINYPTAVMDLGPRQTWINEVCVDPELDVNCSVTRSIGNTSYKGIDDLMEYIIESKEIKERGRLDISDLFDNRGHLQIDGDIAQLLNFNTQAGIYPFEFEELDSPYTALYTDRFDGRGAVGIDFIYSVDNPGTQIIEFDGKQLRLCINEPGRLGDCSQKIPYYKWETFGNGFGDSKSTLAGYDPTSGKTSEIQSYITWHIYNQRLQEFKANLNPDLNDIRWDNDYIGNDSTDSVTPYLLPPIRDCIDLGEGPKKYNDNYKEYSIDGHRRHAMEIGVPFHFNFGLKKGNTAFDKFLESYGPR